MTTKPISIDLQARLATAQAEAQALAALASLAEETEAMRSQLADAERQVARRIEAVRRAEAAVTEARAALAQVEASIREKVVATGARPTTASVALGLPERVCRPTKAEGGGDVEVSVESERKAETEPEAADLQEAVSW